MTSIPPVPKGVVASNEATRDKLYHVAKYQRWVLQALLANIILIIVGVCIGTRVLVLPQSAILAFRLACLAIALLMTAAAYLLARQFYNVVVAVLCGLLMWVPCISLIVLVVINQKATRHLQQYGIKVGLLGANPNRLQT